MQIEHPHFVKFCEEHFPNVATSVVDSSEPFVGTRLLTRSDARLYALTFKRDIVREFGNSSYPIFKRALRLAITKLHKIVQSSPRTFKAHTFTDILGTMGRVQFFYRYLPRKRSLSDKLKDITLNVEHVQPWMQRQTEEIGHFSISPALTSHPEALMYLELNHSGQLTKKIATVGFRLLHSETGNVLSINNIQGILGQRKPLEDFSKASGEQWHVYLCKKLIEHARERGFAVEGELPWPFHREHAPDPEDAEGGREYLERRYQRQVGHYDQTFHNLGMKKARGKWVLPRE